MEQNILKALSEIVYFVKGPNDYLFSPELETLDCLQAEADFIREKLGISTFQAALLGVSIEASAGRRTSLRDIAEELDCSYLELISHMDAFDELRRKGYLRIVGERVSVPSEALDALKANIPFEMRLPSGYSSSRILFRLRQLFDKVSHDSISEEALMDEADQMLKSNPGTCLAMAYNKHIAPLELDDQERYLFLLAMTMSYHRDIDFETSQLRNFFNDESSMDLVLFTLDVDPESLMLMRQNVLQFSTTDGLAERYSFRIRQDILDDLFKDAARGKNNGRGIYLEDSSKRPFKNLIFNKAEAGQVKRLHELMSVENLNRIFETMKAEGMRTGFTCLFYGAPGTGKTETAWQLAKATGRKVLCADVASLKGMYVGESEKNTRRLFADYRAALEENELTPILLFNEADAILGVRMENTKRAVDKMENSVQNILLEEMENFNGILIATTNLTGNLDPAFERRFLYKVRFEKPAEGTRARIWQSIIPDLSEEEARQLAADFDFSGGQIENVARKRKVDTVLLGHTPSFKTLCRYCSEETLADRPGRRPIGF